MKIDKFKTGTRVVFNYGSNIEFAQIVAFEHPYWRVLFESDKKYGLCHAGEFRLAIDPNELLKEIL